MIPPHIVRAGLLIAAAALTARAEPFFPTSPGTTWEYEVAGAGPHGAQPTTLTVRISGQEEINGKPVLKLETLAEGNLLKTEIITGNERGLLCFARRWSEEKSVRFDPPQILIPAPLTVGARWECDDTIAGSDMRQQWSVAAEEEVEVPAGKFKAYRLHSEQPWPVSITFDRWFVPGTGFVKDVTTTRGPTGRLLSRVTTQLRNFSVLPIAEATASPSPAHSRSPTPTPPLAPSPTGGPTATPVKAPSPGPEPIEPDASPPALAPMRIKLEVAPKRDAPAETEFRSDVSNIFVRWAGENLPINSGVRVAWIAEDVGEVAPPNFIVDQTETMVTTANFGARFTLSRPKDGWAAGKYRVELFLEEELIATVSVTIKD